MGARQLSFDMKTKADLLAQYAAWRWLPTSEVTEPGWYWQRNTDAVGEKPTITEIIVSDGELLIYDGGQDGIHESMRLFPSCEFQRVADPLP